MREAQVIDRVPYMVVVGLKEAEEGTVSVRQRGSAESKSMPLADFIAKIKRETEERV